MEYFMLLSLTIISGTLAQNCDNTGILHCMEQFPIQEFVKKFNSTTDFETLNIENAVDRFCSMQNQLIRCMEGYAAKCKIPNTLTMDTSLSAGNFLCSEGKRGFIDNFQCMVNKFLVNQNIIMYCTDVIPQLIDNKDDKTGSDASNEKCRVLEKMMACMDDKTKDLCGGEAVKFVHSYLEATTKPLMKGVTCNNV
ncbi:uncharacterized protein LOC133201824 isoform X2 [Saccostrea echinata]|uniref:uncharacterized protein LOC133201824 isoform X2 n=1 Tax=Saccostrea echinata TaxID=191078 RepID=UPI002A82852C|nr:uncharacterized protein LOC133201824 isoform X2 [Saccostrea echinata]